MINKFILSSLFFILFALTSCFSSDNKNVDTSAAVFKIEGTKIIGTDGNEFLIKGVNVNGPGWCFPRDTLQDINLIIDIWKFNTVRLCAATKWDSWAASYNKDLDALVKAFTERGIVVILELHDYTGIYPPLDDNGGYKTPQGDIIRPIKDLIAWWTDKAKRFKNNQYVWFNIMNEPGAGSSKNSADNWLYVHEEVIKVIRNEGAPNIIVLDDHSWGQANGYISGINSYDSACIRMGPELNKKYSNLLYSLHVYETWADGKNRFENYFRDAKNSGLAVIVGEYGAIRNGIGTHNSSRSMFNSAIPNNIGRIYWAWDDNSLPLVEGENGRGYMINKKDGTKPSNLTWAGDLVWQDNRGLLTVPVPDYDLGLPLLFNGDFEDKMNGWQSWGGSSVGNGVSHNGSAALVVSAGGSGGAGQSMALKPNTAYNLSAWGKGNCDIGIKYRLIENDPNEHHNIITFNKNEWEQKSISFTTPKELFGQLFFIWKNDADPAFYLDDIVVSEK
ncbi:MAG: cellulase family glycosylhydrolase [Treponema sp.]|nr:cellulase family glycosylhydrolase [Treponema sp.]